jgi:peptidyl-dipeptidase Dcp
MMSLKRIAWHTAGLLCALAVTRAFAAGAPPPNALLEPWTGPHGGVPPFDRVSVGDLRAAFDVAMERSRLDLAAIARSSEPATFENTIAALEDQGRTFTRVAEVYGVWSNVMNGPEFEALERDMAPRLAAFYAETTQDEALFRRVAAVYESAEKPTWTPEQRRLVELYYRDFVQAGARLDAAGKRRVAAIDERLAALYASFSANVRHDEGRCTWLESEADLAGLPEAARAAAAAAAATCGGKGKWAIANTRSAVAAFLGHSDRRDLRERVWRNYDDRGDHGDAHDNNAMVSQILELRAERARLLGYATHAHLATEAAMVKSPERAVALLESLWTPAVARVREEVAAMQVLADRSPTPAPIAPWDYRYYGEKVRKATYDVDESEVKQYLQLETLREGMFHLAGELFGLELAPATGVPVYHPDVRAFEARDRETGRSVGWWYFDPYARPGKYNGGLTDIVRIQERFRGERTAIVLNSTPFEKPGRGEPALLGWRDAQTLFHEFGHAMHNLRSNATYPSLAGSRVVKGYGEFPSQLFEKWLASPEVLRRFARHHRTGKPIPQALVAKLARASTFNQGFYTVDYLTSALVEMKMHLAAGQPIDTDAFERDALKSLGAPEEVGMRYRMPHFTHVFAGDAYSAGYYMYLLSDMHAADAFEAFAETGDVFDRTVAARLRAHVFSVGNTVDPFEGYRAFRGRDATLAALMRARGFARPPAASSAAGDGRP